MTRRIFFLLCLGLFASLVGCAFFRRTTAGAETGAEKPRTPPPLPGVPSPASPEVRRVNPSPDGPTDFAAAAEAARGWRDPGLRSRVWGELLGRWIEQDVEAALAYVRKLPPGEDATQGLLLVLDAIGRRDPERCLALASVLAVNREEQAIYSSIFARLAENNPAANAHLLEQVPLGEPRDNALRALANGWARRDFEAAWGWAGNLPEDQRPPAIEAALAALISTDPLRALELAQKSLTGPALNRTVEYGLQTLTPIDPAAAGALVTLLPAGDLQRAAATDVARALAAQNLQQALAWTGTLPPGDARRLALDNVLDIWARNDAPASGQYVAQMVAGDDQRAAAQHLGYMLGAQDPQKALVWAEALPVAAAREAALLSVVSSWAENDPAAAARWAATQTSPGRPKMALGAALSYWVLQDAGAARAFVGTLAGDNQVEAAVSIAPSLAQIDGGAAVRWAQTLPAPEARNAALAAAFARWSDNAPAPARDWLASAALPDELKTRLAPRE